MVGTTSNVGPGGTTSLFRIDGYNTASPTVVVLGNTGGAFADVALSSTGTLYAISPATGVSILNPTTGAITSSVTSAVVGNSLAWADDNHLYTLASGLSATPLRSYSLSGGTVTTLATLPSGGNDLAWDPLGGLLYAHTANKHLYRIDRGTGSFTDVGLLDLGTAGASIAIDASGQMYATTAADASGVFRYYSVDKNTGSFTLIADFSSLGIGTFGLGASPVPVPEPHSLLLTAAALGTSLSFAWRMRKRRPANRNGQADEGVGTVPNQSLQWTAEAG